MSLHWCCRPGSWILSAYECSFSPSVCNDFASVEGRTQTLEVVWSWLIILAGAVIKEKGGINLKEISSESVKHRWAIKILCRLEPTEMRGNPTPAWSSYATYELGSRVLFLSQWYQSRPFSLFVAVCHVSRTLFIKVPLQESSMGSKNTGGQKSLIFRVYLNDPIGNDCYPLENSPYLFVDKTCDFLSHIDTVHENLSTARR